MFFFFFFLSVGQRVQHNMRPRKGGKLIKDNSSDMHKSLRIARMCYQNSRGAIAHDGSSMPEFRAAVALLIIQDLLKIH